MYICARCREDFSYIVLLVTLNAYILFTESFLVITFTNKLLYEFIISLDFTRTGPDGKNPSGSNSARDSRHERDQPFLVPVPARKQIWHRDHFGHLYVTDALATLPPL